ncbi:MAG: peptidylprolyl isomerase [Anaerolineales bacterium]
MNDSQTNNLTVQDNYAVGLEYTLVIDGEVYEQTEENQLLYFIQGGEQIIPGLESQLYGMKLGERREIKVSPEEGYGEYDEDAIGCVPRSELPDDIPVEKGAYLQLRDKDGEVLDAYIEDYDEKNLDLNFNHPLAGKELFFSVKVADLRPATEEEIEHGHVHE